MEKAAQSIGYDFNGLHKPNDENDNYSLAYAQFVVPLVKAVQEQQQMIEDQKKQNAQLQQRVALLEQAAADKSSISTGLNAVQGQGSTDNFSMEQNIPNPFTGSTTINYTLPQQYNSVYLAVYDLSGKQIASFPVTQKGTASLSISSDKLAAGIYIYSMIADGKVLDSKRMVVVEK